MRVIIYVEGSSDKDALEALLAPLIAAKYQQGVGIEFFPVKGSNNQRGGDAKEDLVTKFPLKAVSILRNEADAIVILLPDLYPKNKGFTHETFQELKAGIINKFEQSLSSKGIEDERIKKRFQVFCLKYELEALILAAESELANRLEVNPLRITWKVPVEDQNHGYPPSKLLEKLFEDCGKTYKKTVDASIILGMESVSYQAIAERCHQCFKPFVEFLEGLDAAKL
ncbi:MAG TPA: hypothetical protein DCL61_20375 [Cyanobacteria bacterium UBA12227]|nr:hypothetical protein [Cyanobacteria bacterium UBA12227]HAX88856.1 hypothetical protein [Cyanobacteria bacterium UBA11370]HBY75993.1 hypothetical protein [Cyanobacteria bacterium UBA11148]